MHGDCSVTDSSGFSLKFRGSGAIRHGDWRFGGTSSEKNLIESGLASKTNVILHTDSSAAKSMAARFGATRRTRHIELRYLYLQSLAQTGSIRLSKIAGTDNVSYIMTKYVSSETLRKHMSSLGLAHVSDT